MQSFLLLCTPRSFRAYSGDGERVAAAALVEQWTAASDAGAEDAELLSATAQAPEAFFFAEEVDRHET